ncbi:hypothetical protein B0H13DRAFT_2405313 [Mycena leptocephala]|nr:hypothetical protein B0H13DRAFT_2405313 [Mycena leptocephala]
MPADALPTLAYVRPDLHAGFISAHLASLHHTQILELDLRLRTPAHVWPSSSSRADLWTLRGVRDRVLGNIHNPADACIVCAPVLRASRVESGADSRCTPTLARIGYRRPKCAHSASCKLNKRKVLNASNNPIEAGLNPRERLKPERHADERPLRGDSLRVHWYHLKNEVQWAHADHTMGAHPNAAFVPIRIQIPNSYYLIDWWARMGNISRRPKSAMQCGLSWTTCLLPGA